MLVSRPRVSPDPMTTLNARASSVGTGRARITELGVALVVLGTPLVFVPMSHAPFVDPKLVVLLAGALMIWAGVRGRTGTPLVVAAAVWVGALALAGLAGVDPWWSLVGPENTANGLLLLGASAFLLVAGVGLPEGLVQRIPPWLVWISTALGVVGILFRVWPGTFDLLIPDLSFEGATLGHPVFLAGLLAVGIMAVLALDRLAMRWMVLVLLVQSSALALTTKRVGWVALVIGLTVALWRSRPVTRRRVVLIGVVVATLAGWTLIDTLAGSAGRFSAAARFGDEGSTMGHLTMIPPLTEAWLERPTLGWGPGNAWGAYVHAASPELAESGRGIGDAHNMVVESAVTTGIVGLLAFLVLAALTIRAMRRGSREAAWAAGAAVGLGAYHLIQPHNVYLTPLMFLLAGVACRPGHRSEEEQVQPTPAGAPAKRAPRTARPARLAHGLAGILLAGGLVVAVAGLAASVLEQWGEEYYSEGSLRASLQLAPGRVTAAEALALSLALDGRGGDEAAAREAAALAERTVRMHPWNPGVRLVAADVHILLKDLPGARRWVREHLVYFPNDSIPPLPETLG